MRYILLKKPAQAEKEAGTVSEADILKSVVGNAQSKGYSIKDMRRALAVLAKIDDVREPEGTLALEDEEYNFVKSMFKDTVFRVVSPVIVELSDKIDDAPNKIPS